MKTRPDAGEAEAWNQKARLFYEHGAWASALAAYRQCEMLAGQNLTVSMNIAKCHFQLGDIDNCIILLESISNNAADMGYFNLFYDLGSAYLLKNNPEKASFNYRKYSEYTNFSDTEALTRAIATTYMSGNLCNFWRFFENRRKFPWHVENHPEIPPWHGPAEEGGPTGRLLVHGEQGFGDQIQFSRFINILIRDGILPTISVSKPLVRFFKSTFPQCEVIGLSDVPPGSFDQKCSMVSLPYLLKINNLDEICRHRLILNTVATPAPQASRRLQVGLVWKGNPHHTNDQKRSLPASYLKPLLDMKGVDFISLNPALADGVARAGLPNLIQAVHFGDDFLRTAEVISTLDLVITVDSAPAHLAGSLGVPVWTLLPHEPDWRWDLNSKTTPWYPSMRLYRQQTPGDWTGVIAMVTEDLKSRQTANPGE